MHENIEVSKAKVLKRYFSEIPTLRMRDNYCFDIRKTIYEKQSYPSNKGGLEKAFMEFCDSDSNVEAFIKINENYHDFARINYVRSDGMLASYSPDFIVKTKNNVSIMETKAQNMMSNDNVRLKQIATLDWIKRVNQLNADDRMNAQWEYALLGENTFYSLRGNGANIIDILKICKIANVDKLF